MDEVGGEEVEAGSEDMLRRWRAGRRGARRGEWWGRRRSISGELLFGRFLPGGDGMMGKVRWVVDWAEKTCKRRPAQCQRVVLFWDSVATSQLKQ